MIEAAKQIIEKNWRDRFTIPTSRLYPFQWMWDSGFVALGTSLYNVEKSMMEIESMFSGQWSNGMVPHILFHSESETTYFPNYDFWNSNVNSGAPSYPKSSGITQPPVFGFVLEELYRRHQDNEEVVEFVKRLFPKVVDSHRFLYDYRDVHGEGLFYIYHPWESGRDNSPIWDESLNRIVIKDGDLPYYERRDIQIADASERPTAAQYDRYVYLLELGKSHNYDGKKIAEESPFLIQDCMMNAILIKSNKSLISLGKALGFGVEQLQSWQELSMSNFSKKFWSEELQTFVCYDLRGDKQMLFKEIGGLVALFAEVADSTQAESLATYLQSISDRGYFLCPSFDIDSELFDSKRYWRGPVWPQMNWMISKGLALYGYDTLANQVKSDIIALVDKLGFYEYFESEKEKVDSLSHGYGGSNFSWTASTIINLIAE